MAESEIKYPGEVKFSLTTSERITDAGRDHVLSQLRRAHEVGAIDVGEYQNRLDFVMDSLTKARAEMTLQDLPKGDLVSQSRDPNLKIHREHQPGRRAVLARAALIPLGAMPFMLAMSTVGVDPASNAGQAADGGTALLAFWWIVIWSLLTAAKASEIRRARRQQ